MNLEESNALAERLEKCYTGAIHDVLRKMGRSDFVLPKEINALHHERRIAGPAFTLSGRFEEGLDDHETLLAWTGMLSAAPAGHVLVCQPNNDSLSHMGELSAETLQFRGVRGYVVDGGCRDVEFILGIGFPVFCRYTTPLDVVGCWIPHRLGEPIRIGRVDIRTGDWIVADQDGALVIPADMIVEVLEESETVMQTESLVRKAILQGMDPQEAYLKYGKF
jgi:regulator of RNase E activity RraA